MIFPIPRDLQPPHHLIDENCHFVGPMIDSTSRVESADSELAAHLDGPEPVVLVSLGTRHAGTKTFFRSCFSAFADLPARIVLAVGSEIASRRLGQPPPNTLVRASVAQLDVLTRTSVFVTHGGMNNVMEGLVNGVPMVVVPEQLTIGSLVAE